MIPDDRTGRQAVLPRSPFVIARGAKTEAHVIVVEIGDGPDLGRGEAVPYGRYGESMASAMAQQKSASDGIATRNWLLRYSPAGMPRSIAEGVRPLQRPLGCPVR